MTKLILSILPVLLVQFSLLAFNGEKRLSKKKIVSIKSNENGSLLLNDSNGNIFNYNGEEVIKIDFDNDIDDPTFLLSMENNTILFVKANTVYEKRFNQEVKEILSVPAFEKIVKAVQNKDYFFVSSSNTLYQIKKSSGEVTALYENNIEKTNKLVCSDDDCYLAMNNIVINLSKGARVEHNLPEIISGIDFHNEHGLLSLCNDEVYLSKRDGSKKLFPTIGNLPNDIIHICGSNRWLYLITKNDVSVFDWIHSEVKHLGNFTGYEMAYHIDQWNNLWVSTNEGIWNFSGLNSFDSPRIIDVKITDRNNKTLNSKKLSFNKETSLINITPHIVYLPNTEKLINEWRVGEANWRPFTKDFALSEKMLADGMNSIFIRSKSNESDYSMPYKLEIDNAVNQADIPPFWYAIFGLIGALLIVALFSLFSLRSKQNEDLLTIEKLKSENELLKSRQQIDQLKMNPHFIFNALNSINGLVATGKNTESRKAISLFSKFLRQFLYQSQGEDILLEDEIQLLKNYVSIEQVCRNDKFSFEIKILDDSLLDVKVPNMIIQPFIENAIVHAFPDQETKGKIIVTIKEEEGYLIAEIVDDGIGIKNSSDAKKDHKSVATALVRKRLAQRDKNRRKSYLEYQSNQPGTIAKIFLQKL